MIEDRSGAPIDWKKEYEKECERSMMAGSQLSALRLQLKDAEARAASAARPEVVRIEPFVVKHYGDDQFPTIKGNGFDGLQVGKDREEAEGFIKWINERLVPQSSD